VKQVILRREARADTLEAYQWYEKQEPGLGAGFRDELRATIQRIRANTLGYRVVYRETRRARLKRFPCGVFFREFPDAIVVVAVMHTRRHPKRWQRR